MEELIYLEKNEGFRVLTVPTLLETHPIFLKKLSLAFDHIVTQSLRKIKNILKSLYFIKNI